MEKTISRPLKLISLKDLILGIIGFFLGRVFIINSVNPFVVAYLSCLLFSGASFYIGLLFVIIAVTKQVESIFLIKYLLCFSSFLIINIFFSKIKKNSLLKALIGGLIIFFSGLLYILIEGFSLYYLLLTFLESVLAVCFSVVITKGLNLDYRSLDIKKLNTEEIIGISLIIGAVILGSVEITIIGVSITHLLIISIGIFITYSYGELIGCTSGIFLCLFLGVIGNIQLESLVIYPISFVFLGIYKEKSKILSLLIFDFSVVILNLFFLGKINLDVVYAIVVCNILFMIVNIQPVNVKANQINSTNLAKDFISNKLLVYSQTFERLGRTFLDLSDKKISLDSIDVSKIVDELASIHCEKCDYKKFCWEKNFYQTYQNIFDLLAICEKNGKVDTKNIPKKFINNCEKSKNFVEDLNRIFEIYKLNMFWKNRIVENRELVSMQIGSIAKGLLDISNNIHNEVYFKENISNNIINSLEKNKVFVKNVFVTEEMENKINVIIKYDFIDDYKLLNKKIISIVNDVTGKKMCGINAECLVMREDNKSVCTLKIREEEKFRVSTGVFRVTKQESELSGDSHTAINFKNGTYLLGLSDGMGSGEVAKKESIATLELFEDFIKLGFDKKAIINIVNSTLYLKSLEESFSTLDICLLDLYSGSAEFIKIGAVSTFIIRDENVERIRSTSLPIGILNKVEPEIFKKRLKDNDTIVMITDGVIDCYKEKNKSDELFGQLLLSVCSKNVDEMAKNIINRCIENCNGEIIDDMTVIVSRIWT